MPELILPGDYCVFSPNSSTVSWNEARSTHGIVYDTSSFRVGAYSVNGTHIITRALLTFVTTGLSGGTISSAKLDLYGITEGSEVGILPQINIARASGPNMTLASWLAIPELTPFPDKLIVPETALWGDRYEITIPTESINPTGMTTFALWSVADVYGNGPADGYSLFEFLPIGEDALEPKLTITYTEPPAPEPEPEITNIYVFGFGALVGLRLAGIGR